MDENNDDFMGLIMKKMLRSTTTAATLVLLLAGCATPVQNPTDFGKPFQAGAVGAATGAMIGAPFAGVGAPIGAIAGAVVGTTSGAIEELISGRTEDISSGEYNPIYFGENSTKILPMYTTELNNAATTLRNHPQMMASLVGYTDYNDNKSFNYTLSLARASAVAFELQCRGVPKDQIHVYGAGYADIPTATQCAVNRQFNRKVKIYIHHRSNAHFQSLYAPLPRLKSSYK
jgi:outer membrane protein OmpA-like peptidoglycan-associated protein